MTECICSRQMMACTNAKDFASDMQAAVPVSPRGSGWRLTLGNWVLVSNSGVASELVPARTRVIIHSLLHPVMHWSVFHGPRWGLVSACHRVSADPDPKKRDLSQAMEKSCSQNSHSSWTCKGSGSSLITY